MLKFDKYTGIGNDFVVVDAASEKEGVSPAEAHTLCNRTGGVGADGVLVLLPPRDPAHAVRMRVINSDGSISEMCGNGLRCVALHLARKSQGGHSFQIETDAGLRVCTVQMQGEGRAFVQAEMGIVQWVRDDTLFLEGASHRLAVADAGNPHAVTFDPYTTPQIASLGPQISTHPQFPKGTNVNFATIGTEGIHLVVWERGAGLTLACGTGACATVAVACTQGRMPWGHPVQVHLPGGILSVAVHHDGKTVMQGPARWVFSGQVDLGNLS